MIVMNLFVVRYTLRARLVRCKHGGGVVSSVVSCRISLIFFSLSPTTNYNTDPEDLQRISDKTRKLGLVVIRGTQVSLVSPQDGMEEIANPFLAADDDEEDNEEEQDAAVVKEEEE
jgi:U6 snRNA-associated Sm-like protein LSm7